MEGGIFCSLENWWLPSYMNLTGWSKLVGRMRQLERQAVGKADSVLRRAEGPACSVCGVYGTRVYQATTVSQSQSFAFARESTSQWRCISPDCFLWIDRSVRSVNIRVCLPCIDRLLQGTLGRELLLQNYYINVTVMSKRRVVNTIISTCKHY